MLLTKFEHSCMILDEQGKNIVIDPGAFSASVPKPTNVVAIVITHNHPDHFDPERIKTVLQLNPTAKIYSTQQVVDALKLPQAEVVKPGRAYSIPPFNLEFFGEQHELFTDTQNIGVMVNDKFYYPGDSYTAPGKAVTVLAAPASAPWLRVTEAGDFIKAVKPQVVFPAHNALLSEIGESIHYRILGEAAAAAGAQWQVLKPGQSLEV